MYLKKYLTTFKETKIWYKFLEHIFIPIYKFFWEYIVNFYGKLLYFFWFFKKKEFFNFKDDFTLKILEDYGSKEIATKISNYLSQNNSEIIKNYESKIKNVNTQKKINKHADFKISLNDSLSVDIKKNILDFALSEKNLSTASKYLKVFPVLRSISVDLNVALENKTERGSMLWHKDDFGFKSLDLFVTLCNLDDSNGPLFYVKKKNPIGVFLKLKNIVENPTPGERNKVTLDEFKRYFSEDEIDSLRGESGTSLFIDPYNTYHRGGYCKSRNRLMLRIVYQTPDSVRIKNLNELFLNTVSLNKKYNNLYYNYTLFKNKNIFKLNEKLLSIYRLLHYKK
jgi:hypothetical protein